MTDRLQVVYRHDPSIVARVIGGEMILVPIRKNVGDMESIYTLNETAARIWELTDGKRTLLEIHRQIVDEFAIDALQAETDLLELVDNLLVEGALTKA